jgi:multicomponent Na+:H+ antiporter subunit B
MISIIFRTATRFLVTLLMLFSVFLLLRGHNEPGGGFIGGLVAAAAFSMYATAFDVQSTRRALRIDPRTILAAGLLLAAWSGVAALFLGEPYMTGQWFELDLPLFPHLDIGTPLIFDIGVYFVVVGTVMTILLSLAEE